ncbi:hypothetical protein NQ318_018879 [Aromia moschata]|uniref:EGF-like domain-containing protein n=1 Tax=Aromia moschata TaxID=1265417 RepID=A0AAV8ZHI9_9CUCU|nr:hypothetical protein NQ318_018879 [Aromia moschata]
MINEVLIPLTSHVTGDRQHNVDYDTAYTGKDQYRNAYLVPYKVMEVLYVACFTKRVYYFAEARCVEYREYPYVKCECQPGYTGNGTYCTQIIDECELLRPCKPGVACYNLNPGHRCGGCPHGFTGSKCVDIDECADPRTCVAHSECTNTPNDSSSPSVLQHRASRQFVLHRAKFAGRCRCFPSFPAPPRTALIAPPNILRGVQKRFTPI